MLRGRRSGKMLFSVFTGRHADPFSKLCGQVVAVAVAGFHGNIHDRLIALGEEYLNMSEADIA